MNSSANFNDDLRHMANTYCDPEQNPDLFFEEMIRLIWKICETQRINSKESWESFQGNRWSVTNGQRLADRITNEETCPIELVNLDGEPIEL